jgi:hypothetical protein
MTMLWAAGWIGAMEEQLYDAKRIISPDGETGMVTVYSPNWGVIKSNGFLRDYVEVFQSVFAFESERASAHDVVKKLVGIELKD